MPDWLKRLFPPKKGKSEKNNEELEHLRESFKTRYQNFQRLLAANKKTLKSMTEIEEALEGKTPPSMAFIRSRSTRVATSVLQIIRHLDKIAPKKYEPLYDRFKKIQTQLGQLLAHQAEAKHTPLVIPLHAARLSLADQLGGKMAALGELGAVEGARIPEGFVITAEAYRLFVEQSGIRDEINRIIQTQEREDNQHEVSARIEQLIIDTRLPAGLETAILENYDRLEKTTTGDLLVAVRSSAVGEDGHEMSFAGQYQSILDVPRSDLFVAYKKVIAGKYSARAMSYRLHYGVRDDEVAMCVGCMPMVEASAGGVAYTSNPLDETDDKISVYSVRGLPQQVVDGSADVDTFIVTRDDARRVVHREIKDADSATLSDEKIVALASLALRVEEYFGAAQDIEWALDVDDQIVLLQSRPLTERGGAPERDKSDSIIEVSAEKLFAGGVTASRGAAAGPVFVARGVKDVAQFPAGSILVAAQPLPYWATLLGRAAAVVTEQGSVACHLANVAREYGVPALFDVADATQRLNVDGPVTVDADNRFIYLGRIEQLLEDRPIQRRRIVDSPVYQSLKKVSGLILPLHLLDPDGPDFIPERCETFHDITRFCHEKAVTEMFQFGVEHDFPERASRRLFTDVATQFWVIDLDDGLTEEANDPYFVRLEEIVSLPMLAIWRGMKSLAWEGPPPVDARGFFQVVAESTMDTDLNASMPSRYSAGSHFMISKNYCSLQSRFGYHFAGVEALVGERAMENYVAFQFGGGGAGQERQHKRALLIAEVLEENGFQAECQKDNVNARIGGFDRPRMERALEVVGYLLVHTRQLDMVMSDSDSFAEHKEKIVTDLERLKDNQN